MRLFLEKGLTQAHTNVTLIQDIHDDIQKFKVVFQNILRYFLNYMQ